MSATLRQRVCAVVIACAFALAATVSLSATTTADAAAEETAPVEAAAPSQEPTSDAPSPSPDTAPSSETAITTAAASYIPCRQDTFPGDDWAICRYFAVGTKVMRWGNANWGYRHIRDRRGYGETTDQRIDYTLSYGSVEAQGSARIYRANAYGCPYKVVYETNGPQGVITAYCVG